VFDVETTGLSSVYDTIVELAGVKRYSGEIIDRFERFANPHRPLPEKIADSTGVTDSMLVDASEVDYVLQEIYDWVGDSIYVAYNATSDIGSLHQCYRTIGLTKVTNVVANTLEFASVLLLQ